LISRVRGVLETVAENRIEVRSGDLSYEVLVPSYLEQELRTSRGDQVELYVQHYMEGGSSHANMMPRLVGFTSEADREFYAHLVKVPGLGSRSVLKSMAVPPAQMANAIEREDRIKLSGLPGVGKRTADKIIATLKGKVSEFAFGEGAPTGPAGPLGEVEEEAVEVLVQLAYRRNEAELLIAGARKKNPGLDSAESMVQAALRESGKGALR
jgi:Holliday junction DNA helicase RuvA